MSELKKILVIDDSSANLTVINGILGGKYKVYPVDSGATALRFIEKMRPDLILLDIEMPGMGGIELFGIIKSDAKMSGVPVIFLTAHDNEENEAEAFRIGISDYIRKPVNDVILMFRVGLHLELAELRAAKING